MKYSGVTNKVLMIFDLISKLQFPFFGFLLENVKEVNSGT